MIEALLFYIDKSAPQFVLISYKGFAAHVIQTPPSSAYLLWASSTDGRAFLEICKFKRSGL